MTTRLRALPLLALLAACRATPAPPAADAAKPAFGTFGIDTANMDFTVAPGDDFHAYVNGKWIATATIPPDKARYGVFDALGDQTERNLRLLVEEAAGAPQSPGSVTQKVADFYRSWMDEQAIEQRGLSPLEPDLRAIASAATKADLLALMARPDFTGPVSFTIEPDPADASKYVVFIGQAGLGMPNRDYYLRTGDRFDAYRSAYRTYLARTFELIGQPAPATSADEVLALETKLATEHWSPDRQRDVRATTNPMDRAGLAALAPAIQWPTILAAAGLEAVQRVVVRETTAVRGGVALLSTESVDVWKKYLAFHLANSYASYLPKALDDASFAFHERALRGIEVPRERWKRGVSLLDRQLGEGIGELYVAKHFLPPDHKDKMDALVANLRTAVGARLKTLAWMDDTTRAEALKKLATFDPRVGYPAKWRDYRALAIHPGTLFENVRHARRFHWDRQVARFPKPVDRGEWGMTPQTVNAYYDPTMNQITFPAAILQPPFFDPSADPAVNYGAIGAVIGHEMGHGFDDQGREYDETGRIRNWWTPDTNARFLEQTKRLVAQYNAFCPLPPLCVNGQLTLGENIGDLGGLEMAYTAYRLSLNGGTAPVLEGFSGDQRFFMAHAQLWRAILREDAQRNRLLTDPHAPPEARGSYPERNMDAWYAAFGVKEGHRLYLKPEDRVRIW